MLLRTKIEIEKWLNKYDIENYELIPDEKYGYVVNVDKNLLLRNKRIEEIKVKFNIVNGIFDCAYNYLKSLEGCPKIVNGNFWCGGNMLKNLIGGPKVVKGVYNCIDNKLISLEGCSEIIYDKLSCNHNKLTMEGLQYMPNEVKNNYINLESNPKLRELQNKKDFNEIKKIIQIKKEKKELSEMFKEIKIEKINKEKINKI